MTNTRKLTLLSGVVAAWLAATGLAAQNQVAPQAPMMEQGQGMLPMMGMMPQMSQMMEACASMMQAHMAQPQQPARDQQ